MTARKGDDHETTSARFGRCERLATATVESLDEPVAAAHGFPTDDLEWHTRWYAAGLAEPVTRP